MRNIVQRINYSPKYAKILEWGKLISMIGTTQALIQGITLVSGILIIRFLSTGEYALYTLTNTALASLNFIADGGISTAVMAQGGQHWQDREKLGAVIATGLNLRKKFGLFSLIIAIPVLIILLLRHQASILFTVLIVLSLIPSFLATLADNMLEVAPKLKQDISLLQKNQLFTSIGRLVLVTASIFVFPFTFIVMLGNGIPRMLANVSLKKKIKSYVDFEQKPDPVVQQRILKIVKRNLPDIIYYSLSGQITIWLISVLGTTAAVAQVGAIGRFSAMLSLVGIIFGTLVVPRFARLKNEPKQLISRYIQIHILMTLICVVIVAGSWLFSTQLLWVLGSKYFGLNDILVLSMVAGCFNLLLGVSFGLYSSRGYIIHPVLSISLNILIMVCGLFLFKISTVHGIFMYNIFVAFIQAILHFIFGLFKLLKEPKIENNTTGALTS